MSDDKAFKMRPAEKDDFQRWSLLTSATISGTTTYQLFISQPSGRFTAEFVPPDYLIDGWLQRRFCYALATLRQETLAHGGKESTNDDFGFRLIFRPYFGRPEIVC